MFEEAQRAIAPIPSIIKQTDSYSHTTVVEETQVEKTVALEETQVSNTVEEEKVVVQEKEREDLSVIFLPLPSFVMAGDVKVIAQRIANDNIDIVAITGEPVVLESMKQYLSYNEIIVEDTTLLATNLPLENTQGPYSLFTLSDDTSIAFSVVDIREDSYYYEALSGEKVPPVLLKKEMLDEVNRYTSALKDIPTIVFASLYSPFDSSLLSSYNVIDAYEVSHHISQLEKGSTLRIRGIGDNISLRSNYLFTHKMIPLSSTTIDITIAQTRKVPSEQRSAISGTFIIQ